MKRAILTAALVAIAATSSAQFDRGSIRQAHRYGDELYLSGTAISGTWTCSSGETACVGSGGAATGELAIGDALACLSGSYWYDFEVESVGGVGGTDDDAFSRRSTLTGRSGATTSEDLVSISGSTCYLINEGGSATAKTLYDGLGNALALALSTTGVSILSDLTIGDGSATDFAILVDASANDGSVTFDESGDEWVFGEIVSTPDLYLPGGASTGKIEYSHGSGFIFRNTSDVYQKLWVDSLIRSPAWHLNVSDWPIGDTIIKFGAGNYNDTQDLALDHYNDGTDSWLEVSDGDGSGGDGKIVVDEIMIGGTSGYRIEPELGSGRLAVTNTAGTGYQGLVGEYLYATGLYYGPAIRSGGNNSQFDLQQGNDYSAANTGLTVFENGDATHSSGELVWTSIEPTLAETGTAGSVVLDLDVTTTTIGSGGHDFLRCLDDTVEMASIDLAGQLNIVGVEGINQNFALYSGEAYFDSAYGFRWSSTGLLSGPKDLSIHRYNDGTNTWLDVGNGTSGGDGKIVVDEIMIGGTDGPRMREAVAGWFYFKSNDDVTYANLYAGSISLNSTLTAIKVQPSYSLIAGTSQQEITIADSGDGNPGTDSGNLTRSSVEFTCNDADGCVYTVTETSVDEGRVTWVVNVGTNTTTIVDTSGVTELSGDWVGGQWDTLTIKYLTDRWVETGRSDN